MDTTTDWIYSKQETAEMTGRSVRTLERDPDLRPVRVGVRRVGYRATDVAAWIASRETTKSAA